MKLINVQEVFNIQPRLTAESSKEDLQLHIFNVHALILAGYSFMDEKGLGTEFHGWLKKHFKQLDNVNNWDGKWGVVGFEKLEEGVEGEKL